MDICRSFYFKADSLRTLKNVERLFVFRKLNNLVHIVVKKERGENTVDRYKLSISGIRQGTRQPCKETRKMTPYCWEGGCCLAP